MKCKILHEGPGRLRVHMMGNSMSLRQADILEAYLKKLDGMESVKVYDRTGDAVIRYTGSREAVLRSLAVFSYEKSEELAPEHSSRELNREFEDKLVFTVLRRAGNQLFLPSPIRTAIAIFRSAKYIKAGLTSLLHGRLTVSVLDATAVTVSMVRGDFATAGSVMFMLRLGEILEEWTHKKSVADLAGAMSLNVDKVWLKTGETEVLVPIGDVKAGDCIVVRTGGMIPLDGKVDSGEATVNQASITGESLPVPKSAGSYVYAGTVVEEGEVQAIFSHPSSAAAKRLVYPAGAPKAENLPGHKLVRVAFGGTQTTDKPLVASLAIECGALVSIMGADTRIVNGQTLGSMLLALPEDEHAEAALEYIKNYPGITYEEVNN